MNTTTQKAQPKIKGRRLKSNVEWNLFLMLLPSLVFFLLVVALPFLQGIPIAMKRWDGFSDNQKFVGLANFIKLFQDQDVYSSFGHTLLFAFFNITACNVFGLALAILIKEKSSFNNIVRIIVFLPFVISLVLASIMWSYIYTDIVFPIFNIPSPLGSVKHVISGLAIISIWQRIGYCMVIYVAALQTIPEDLFEASSMEGAGPIFNTFNITIPLIMPAITANVSLLLAWSMRVFDIPMTVTGGGPGTASVTVAMYIYNNIFAFFKAGYGQAISLVFLLCVGTLSVLFTRFLRSKEVQL
jgi:raffinose/stachyose/melibiose transport system permease protein